MKHTALPWTTLDTECVLVEYKKGKFEEVVKPGHTMTHEEAKANAEFIVKACDNHYELLEALELAEKLIHTARHYFPKSIKNPDKFQLENTCATIGKAIYKAKEE